MQWNWTSSRVNAAMASTKQNPQIVAVACIKLLFVESGFASLFACTIPLALWSSACAFESRNQVNIPEWMIAFMRIEIVATLSHCMFDIAYTLVSGK